MPHCDNTKNRLALALLLATAALRTSSVTAQRNNNNITDDTVEVPPPTLVPVVPFPTLLATEPLTGDATPVSTEATEPVDDDGAAVEEVDDGDDDIFFASSCLEALMNPDLYSGTCTNSWEVMKTVVRPTQMDIGWTAVAYMLANWFQDAGAAADAVENVVVPVVMGPTFGTSQSVGFYLLDHHHLLAALDYSKLKRITVTLEVVCDWRSWEEGAFWAGMEPYTVKTARDQDDLSAMPVVIDPAADLSTFFAFRAEESSFGDDPYLSLALYSTWVENEACPNSNPYCLRCFEDICSEEDGSAMPTNEFMWAYFFNDALDNNVEAWPSVSTHNAFSSLWTELKGDFPGRNNVAKVNVAYWQAATANLIALCRDAAAGEFQVPYYSENGQSGVLPGYVSGTGAEIEADPVCDAGTCPAP